MAVEPDLQSLALLLLRSNRGVDRGLRFDDGVERLLDLADALGQDRIDETLLDLRDLLVVRLFEGVERLALLGQQGFDVVTSHG